MSCIVLVTGGSGFLGQHVIGLLQSRAPHVTEIRNFDLQPYENKLDYEHKKPLKQFIGSITDREFVKRACQGVSSVIHLASLIDISMFPNMEKLEHVNVTGTSVLLDVCRELGVRHFVYCSSMSVIQGYDDLIDTTEDSVQIPEKLVIPHYGITKQRAEIMVLESNCDELRTLALRPSAIYGEEDNIFITRILELSRKSGTYRLCSCGAVKQQMTYVGNVAWVFVCAENTMHADDTNKIGGNAFFVADDTPPGDVYEMRIPFAKACNFRIASYKVPTWLLIYLLQVFYLVLWLISPFWKVNIPVGFHALRQTTVSWILRYDKAKSLLGYQPLYSYEESFERSMKFYKRYAR